MKILENMYLNAISKERSDVLKTKIEKDCWNSILKILKVLLMSTFVAKLPSPELSLALSRRISSVISEEESKEEKP